MSKRGRFHIGTSGWSYKDWRGRFYPEHLPTTKWLNHFTQVFHTVEINNTFYHQPLPQTFENWERQVPAGFTLEGTLPCSPAHRVWARAG